MDLVRLIPAEVGSGAVQWDRDQGGITDPGRDDRRKEPHKKAILCFAYSIPDSLIYTGSEDETIKVWDAETGENIDTFTGHQGFVTDLCFLHTSPTHKFLFSCSNGGEVFVWTYVKPRRTLAFEQSIEPPEISLDPKDRERMYDVYKKRKNKHIEPAYNMCWDDRESQLICAFKNSIRLYKRMENEHGRLMWQEHVAVADHDSLVNTFQPSKAFVLNFLRDHPSHREKNSPLRTGRDISFNRASKRTSESRTTEDSYTKVFMQELSCMAYYDGTIFTASDTGHICAWRSRDLRLLHKPFRAHEKRITCLVYEHTNDWVITGAFDNAVKIFTRMPRDTPAFQCKKTYMGYSSVITGLCYVPVTETLWVTARSHPYLYDMKTFAEVTDVMNTGVSEKLGDHVIQRVVHIPNTDKVIGVTNKRQLALWEYERSSAVSTLRGHSDVVQAVVCAYAPTEPLLIFSGGSDQQLVRWERQQLNALKYRSETYDILAEEGKMRDDTESKSTTAVLPAATEAPPVPYWDRLHARESGKRLRDMSTWDRLQENKRRKREKTQSRARASQKGSKLQSLARAVTPPRSPVGSARRERPRVSVETLVYIAAPRLVIVGSSDHKIYIYGYGRDDDEPPTRLAVPKDDSDSDSLSSSELAWTESYVGLVTVVRLASWQDSSAKTGRVMYVGPGPEQYASGDDVTKNPKLGVELFEMVPEGHDGEGVFSLSDEARAAGHCAIWVDPRRDSVELAPTNEQDVAHRVDWLCCRRVLPLPRYKADGHTGAITALCGVEFNHCHYLVSTSRDRTLRLWQLSKDAGRSRLPALQSRTAGRPPSRTRRGAIHKQYRLVSDTGGGTGYQRAADGGVLCVEYCSDLEVLAYGSSDTLVYIRKFSPEGYSNMKLVSVLRGHNGPVNAVKWNAAHKTWVTGSDDSTIRIWPANGLECLHALAARSEVLCIAIHAPPVDMPGAPELTDLELRNRASAGIIAVGTQNKSVRVYDPLKQEFLQEIRGHKDAVKSIQYLPEQHQYITGSWDNTVKVWNAWVKHTVPDRGRSTQLPAFSPFAKMKEPDGGDSKIVDADQSIGPGLASLKVRKAFAPPHVTELQPFERYVRDVEATVEARDNDYVSIRAVNETKVRHNTTKRRDVVDVFRGTNTAPGSPVDDLPFSPVLHSRSEVVFSRRR